MDKKTFLADLISRIHAVKPLRWLRFGIVAIIYILWVIWMGTWWLSLGELLLFDIYITGYIPLTWWKKSESKIVRNIMSWVDAIVYALVLVYFVFAFIGQNYQIPSSSLEKTLLTGDYLWVNKFVYGPRVPMTPVHFPLVHNTLFGGKSYLDQPSVAYHRLKGLRNVEEGDIVVFNFPAGDTVASHFEESPQYYELLVKQYGREVVHNNKAMFGDIIYRPVDRRQNFVKRAVALPGERFKIVNDTIYINDEVREFPENVQFNYVFATTTALNDDDLKSLDITPSDLSAFENGSVSRKNIQPFLGDKTPINAPAYIAPLTAGMIEKLQQQGRLLGCVKYNKIAPYFYGSELNSMVFPFGEDGIWTLSNYGGDKGLYIPAKGSTIELTPENWTIYQRCIRNYEGHQAYYDASTGKVVIDGVASDTYTFAMDYYWMMGDNRDNSQDSRFWGFVPEDHIIGTPMIVLASFDRERGLFDGKIRFNRILRSANPDKK